MVTLNDTIHLIILQFSFSNYDAIPAAVERLDREAPEVRMQRNHYSDGVMVIKLTEKHYLAEFFGELEAAGCEMVDAFYGERIDAKDPGNRRTYHMVRLLFARRRSAELSEGFRKGRDIIRAEIRSICDGRRRAQKDENDKYMNDAPLQLKPMAYYNIVRNASAG